MVALAALPAALPFAAPTYGGGGWLVLLSSSRKHVRLGLQPAGRSSSNHRAPSVRAKMMLATVRAQWHTPELVRRTYVHLALLYVLPFAFYSCRFGHPPYNCLNVPTCPHGVS